MSAARGRSLQEAETLIEYAYDKVENSTWASHAAGKYLIKIIAGMKWLNIPPPDLARAVKMAWLSKALQRLKSSKGTRHRKPVSVTQLEWACRRLQQDPDTDEAAVALAKVAFLAMLRSNELRTLAARDLRWSAGKQGGRPVWRVRISDKTHLARNRVATVPVQDSWAAASRALQKRVRHDREEPPTGDRSQSRALLRPAEGRRLAAWLKVLKRSMGGLRPGGNMFWLQAGVSKTLRHTMGGWALGSKVPAKHYTQVNRRVARSLNEQASQAWKQQESR